MSALPASEFAFKRPTRKCSLADFPALRGGKSTARPASRPQLRAAEQAWQSRPILTRLQRALEIVRRRVLPKSLLGQAIDYTLTRWETLTRYVDAGHLEIDNNRCENAIRPTAIGK